MVRAMTGRLQESLSTLAILNPCIGLLPFVFQVSSGSRLALTG